MLCDRRVGVLWAEPESGRGDPWVWNVWMAVLGTIDPVWAHLGMRQGQGDQSLHNMLRFSGKDKGSHRVSYIR